MHPPSTDEVLNVREGHINSAFSSDGRIFSRLGDESVQFPSYIREKSVDSTGLLSHSGWLPSPAGEGYLMFVPLDALLPDSANILTIPHSRASSVDFTGVNLGPQWQSCYRSL